MNSVRMLDSVGYCLTIDCTEDVRKALVNTEPERCMAFDLIAAVHTGADRKAVENTVVVGMVAVHTAVEYRANYMFVRIAKPFVN